MFHTNAASPISGHPANMKHSDTRSADKMFHTNAASPISGHPANMKHSDTRSADKKFHTTLRYALYAALLFAFGAALYALIHEQQARMRGATPGAAATEASGGGTPVKSSSEVVADTAAANSNAEPTPVAVGEPARTDDPIIPVESEAPVGMATNGADNSNGNGPAQTLQLARQAAVTGHLPEAQAHYERHLQAFPKDGIAQSELGNVLIWQGRYAEAAQSYYAASLLLIDAGQSRAVSPMLPVLEQYEPVLAAVVREKLAQQQAPRPPESVPGGMTGTIGSATQ